MVNEVCLAAPALPEIQYLGLAPSTRIFVIGMSSEGNPNPMACILKSEWKRVDGSGSVTRAETQTQARYP